MTLIHLFLVIVADVSADGAQTSRILTGVVK
jgi:hypothetical protein